MSKIIASAAIRGAHEYVREAEESLTATLESSGGAAPLEFPNTAFYRPLTYALTGLEVANAADRPVWDEEARARIVRMP